MALCCECLKKQAGVNKLCSDCEVEGIQRGVTLAHTGGKDNSTPQEIMEEYDPMDDFDQAEFDRGIDEFFSLLEEKDLDGSFRRRLFSDIYDEEEKDLNQSDYNVACNNCDHVFSPQKGSDLEQRCIAREEEGYLDALRITSQECPNCLEQIRYPLPHLIPLDYWD